MKKVKMGIIVRTQFHAYHMYEQAPEQVVFLRDLHRHLFKVELDIEVFDNDRELEFFIVQKELISFVRKEYEGLCFKKGCEQMAEEIGLAMAKIFGEHRRVNVTVSEDGENSGYVVLLPESNIVQK